MNGMQSWSSNQRECMASLSKLDKDAISKMLCSDACELCRDPKPENAFEARGRRGNLPTVGLGE